MKRFIIISALLSAWLLSCAAPRSAIPIKRGAVSATAKFCTHCPRDKHGKLVRSAKATKSFKKQTGYAKGRKGYVIDHIVPLKRGGCDCPANMQWQTIAESKAKDRIE